jgi:hypothetical protein
MTAPVGCTKAPETVRLTGPMVTFLAASVGIIFLNVPAPQTLIGVIGADIGLSPSLFGLVATAPLLGYAAGLFLVTPLADILENRALITRTLAAAVVCATATAFAHGPLALLVALLCSVSPRPRFKWSCPSLPQWRRPSTAGGSSATS